MVQVTFSLVPFFSQGLCCTWLFFSDEEEQDLHLCKISPPYHHPNVLHAAMIPSHIALKSWKSKLSIPKVLQSLSIAPKMKCKL
jgi:hypothetical protein